MFTSKKYNSLFVLTAFTFGSGINITSQLSAFVLLAVMLLIVNFTVLLFSDQPLIVPVKDNSIFFAYLFLSIVAYTMFIRGIGFEMLGSSKSGGMFYVKLLSVLLLFIFLIKIKTSDRFVMALFFSYFISSSLPFLADLLYLFNGGATFLHSFLPGSSTIEFYSQNEGSLLRIQSAASLAEYGMVLMLAYQPLFHDNGKVRFTRVNVILLLLILVLIGLSGHRITLIGISMLLIFYYSYSFGVKKLIKPFLISGIILLSFSLFVILQFKHLPPSFQRTFSFLPFTPSNEVTLDATASLDFRLLMAAKAWIMLPDYYLIGKGFAFINYPVDISDFFGIIDLFAEIGVFHNGLLGLLINLGIPGLLVGITLLISIFKNARIEKSVSSSPLLRRTCIVLKSKLLVSIIYFIVFYGDVQTNFLEIIMLAILYKTIQYHLINKRYQLKANECAF